MTAPLNSLSIVIPAYNEAGRLPATLEELRGFLERPGVRKILSGGVEIVIVDDGSRDGTADEVRAVEELFDVGVLRVHSLPENRGKGAAIRAGFERAKYPWVLVADADGSTDWNDLLTFVAELERPEIADVRAVYGSRHADQAVIEGRSFTRFLGAWGLNKIICFLMEFPFKDTQCGFKLLSSEAARAFAAYGRQDRFSWDIELLVFLKDRGLRVIELPVRWVHKDGSKLRPIRDGIRMVRETWTITRDPRRLR